MTVGERSGVLVAVSVGANRGVDLPRMNSGMMVGKMSGVPIGRGDSDVRHAADGEDQGKRS